MNIKELFAFKKRGCAVQTARKSLHPYSGWMGYIPLAPPDASLFDAMREAIPIIDAALDKIVRLTGGFEMKCSSAQLQNELDGFVEGVRVGASSYGLRQFAVGYLHSLLTYGNAVGEIVPNSEKDGIYALYNANLADLIIREGRTPLEVEICTIGGGMGPVPVRWPEWVFFTPLNPPPGEIRGVPLLRGLPFVTNILMKIFDCMGTNFERAGNLRYSVVYRPGSDRVDKSHAREIAGNIAKEWADAMNAPPGSGVKDFVAVGDVDIKVIGAESQMSLTEIPVRQMLEQIVAKLGIPPFMLGLSWSTTERMSVQQADILTSELESYRRLLDPVLTRICNIFLRLRGYSATAKPVWGDINLQDEAEAANIRLLQAQAAILERQLEKGQVAEESLEQIDFCSPKANLQ